MTLKFCKVIGSGDHRVGEVMEGFMEEAELD